tara:strand:- start:993 stop:1160 length:168 start_codon:yes stop_codon:yes gene_type:complete
MNTLTKIREQINKAARLHDAQIHATTYRGVEYDPSKMVTNETHGTFTYRGKTYTK